jgi:zinc protease
MVAVGRAVWIGLGLALAVPCLPSPPVRAEEPPASHDPYRIDFEKHTLGNGLEVILHRDASLPLVAVNVWYHVGPANEPPGRSGFAHLFEHLMFEGSRHAGRQFDLLMESIGATGVNGTTSWDRTNYFQTFPRQHLELVLWLESDRMGFMLDALDPERLEVQRDVVKNERRQRYENAPYGPSDLAMYDLLYPPGHPYHGAVIGSMEDLSRATLADVRAFFERYYAPSNATVAIAGDIDPAEAKRLVDRYFGALPKRPKPARHAKPTGPLARAERLVVREPVQLGRVAVAWRTPPAFSEDDPALEVASAVLGAGKASRLYQELVVKRQVSPDVNVWLDANAVSSTLSIEAPVARGRASQEVEQIIGEVIGRLAAEGPTDAELLRAKRGIQVSVLSSLQLLNGGGGDSGRAGSLQRMNHYLGDPGRLPTEMARLDRVSRQDVQRAVRAHLGERSATVVTKPAGGGTP